MKAKISTKTKQELIQTIRTKYKQANREEKSKLLDALIVGLGYDRKYAINVINRETIKPKSAKKRGRKSTYNNDVKDALSTLWKAANCICSKRLAPFIPELIKKLEAHGHLLLTGDIKKRLNTISSASIDRLLKKERQKENNKGLCTTKSGGLLKKQIKVRTFTDWDDVVPGFMEADLVAHCGDTTEGSYLNTFVLTDIVSGWTEPMALICKEGEKVIEALHDVQKLLPFKLLGIDTDNGSEFINYGLFNYCEKNKITFTRSRAYKKNDQAHVEEKNGSIVRRLIGYERYEGTEAHQALRLLYLTLRLYINFFQPSLKLISKKREGAKVTKQYDEAQTPYQRLMISDKLSSKEKAVLKKQYGKLDPIYLLKTIEEQQREFFNYAWKQLNNNPSIKDEEGIKKFCSKKPKAASKNKSEVDEAKKITLPKKHDKGYNKPRKKLGPRTWKTQKDPFENVLEQIHLILENNPNTYAKDILNELITKEPDNYTINQLRTLQRRIREWRKEQEKKARKEYEEILSNNVFKESCSSVELSVEEG